MCTTPAHITMYFCLKKPMNYGLPVAILSRVPLISLSPITFYESSGKHMECELETGGDPACLSCFVSLVLRRKSLQDHSIIFLDKV